VITIIDDDESVREAAKNLVRSLGYTAAAFSSAEDYLQSPHLLNSACLITDLQMPGMSGADLQDRLIADGLDTPMIFMTAYFDERVRKRVMDAGAFGFLSKPIDENALMTPSSTRTQDAHSHRTCVASSGFRSSSITRSVDVCLAAFARHAVLSIYTDV
jgi:FixJ family two-component response regulator